MYIQTKRSSEHAFSGVSGTLSGCIASSCLLLLLLLLTLKTTSTIFASSIPSHPTLPLPLDHGQTLLHVHHLVLRWRRTWRKRLHMKRMRMLVLLMRRRSPGKQCWSLLHAQRYMRWTHICCGELQSETVVRHMMLSRRASRWTRRHTIGPMHILQYRWRDVGETLWAIDKKKKQDILLQIVQLKLAIIHASRCFPLDPHGWWCAQLNLEQAGEAVHTNAQSSQELCKPHSRQTDPTTYVTHFA